MKLINLINSTAIVASIAFVPSIAGAEPINTVINSNTISNTSTSTNYLQPFNTAFLAYQGNFKTEGIPSSSALIVQYQTGNLTARDVVQAAINAKKLPVEALNNTSYINAVDSQLKSFNNNLLY